MTASFCRLICGAAAVLALCGCAAEKPNPVRSGLEGYRNFDEATLRTSGLGLNGQGRVLFDRPLASVNSREHYVLEVSDWQEAGTLTLHSHLNSFSLMDGVQVVIRREGNSLTFEMSTPGYPQRRLFVMDEVLGNVDRIRLRLEVHDGGLEGVRLLVWQDSISYQGELITQLPLVNLANAIYDSHDAKSIWQSHGRGVRWGVQLVNLTLQQAFREVPYVE